MRAQLFLSSLLCSSLLLSCSNQVAKVERESAVRSMAEAFDNQFDSSGVLQYGHENGARVFYLKCAQCHGNDGRKIQLSREGAPEGLGASALANPRLFWNYLYFGDKERGMPPHGSEVAFQDLVDVTGYAMRLP